MLLYLLMTITGLSLLVYSFFETSAYGSLYFERDYHCIEKYRKAEKAADLAACCHNVAKGYFGLVLMLLGLARLFQREMHLDNMMVVAFGLTSLDVLVLEVTTRKYGLKDVKAAIIKQWRNQKRISAEHDHEVNMYRAAKTLTEKYPRHLLAMVLGLIVSSLLLSF